LAVARHLPLGKLQAGDRHSQVLRRSRHPPERRTKGKPGQTLVTDEMVTKVEKMIDDIASRFSSPKDFVVPGQNRVSATLDIARTVTRRAEREALSAVHAGSMVLPYLNRLSDLLWTLARWQESATLLAKTHTAGI